MILRIVCPVQSPENFNVEGCAECKYFDLFVGKSVRAHCKKNRSPKHKRDFETAILTARLGIPDTVVVEATEETEKEA